MTNLFFSTGNKKILNDKCLDRRFYAVELAEQQTFSKSESIKDRKFFQQIKK